ncbi:MAG TPA: hypothetical protein VF941_16635 [Clostridia bacterium]
MTKRKRSLKERIRIAERKLRSTDNTDIDKKIDNMADLLSLYLENPVVYISDIKLLTSELRPLLDET